MYNFTDSESESDDYTASASGTSDSSDYSGYYTASASGTGDSSDYSSYYTASASGTSDSSDYSGYYTASASGTGSSSYGPYDASASGTGDSSDYSGYYPASASGTGSSSYDTNDADSVYSYSYSYSQSDDESQAAPSQRAPAAPARQDRRYDVEDARNAEVDDAIERIAAQEARDNSQSSSSSSSSTPTTTIIPSSLVAVVKSPDSPTPYARNARATNPIQTYEPFQAVRNADLAPDRVPRTRRQQNDDSPPPPTTTTTTTPQQQQQRPSRRGETTRGMPTPTGPTQRQPDQRLLRLAVQAGNVRTALNNRGASIPEPDAAESVSVDDELSGADDYDYEYEEEDDEGVAAGAYEEEEEYEEGSSWEASASASVAVADEYEEASSSSSVAVDEDEAELSRDNAAIVPRFVRIYYETRTRGMGLEKVADAIDDFVMKDGESREAALARFNALVAPYENVDSLLYFLESATGNIFEEPPETTGNRLGTQPVPGAGSAAELQEIADVLAAVRDDGRLVNAAESYQLIVEFVGFVMTRLAVNFSAEPSADFEGADQRRMAGGVAPINKKADYQFTAKQIILLKVAAEDANPVSNKDALGEIGCFLTPAHLAALHSLLRVDAATYNEAIASGATTPRLTVNEYTKNVLAKFPLPTTYQQQFVLTLSVLRMLESVRPRQLKTAVVNIFTTEITSAGKSGLTNHAYLATLISKRPSLPMVDENGTQFERVLISGAPLQTDRGAKDADAATTVVVAATPTTITTPVVTDATTPTTTTTPVVADAATPADGSDATERLLDATYEGLSTTTPLTMLVNRADAAPYLAAVYDTDTGALVETVPRTPAAATATSARPPATLAAVTSTAALFADAPPLTVAAEPARTDANKNVRVLNVVTPPAPFHALVADTHAAVSAATRAADAHRAVIAYAKAAGAPEHAAVDATERATSATLLGTTLQARGYADADTLGLLMATKKTTKATAAAAAVVASEE